MLILCQFNREALRRLSVGRTCTPFGTTGNTKQPFEGVHFLSSAKSLIPRIPLPHTDLVVSRFALGTAKLGTAQTESEAHDLLDRYVAMGGNFIDTARVYSDWIPGERGRAERILGEWLAGRPELRGHVIVATKGLHYEWGERAKPRVTGTAARHDLERSLEALGLEQIGFYWLHRDNPELRVETIIDFMQPLLADGRIRYLGASNWSGDRVVAANAYAASAGLRGFDAVQPLFNLGCWHMAPPPDPTLVRIDQVMFAHALATGCAIVAYSPQAGGFFARASRAAARANDLYATGENLRLAADVEDIAGAHRASSNAVALAYLLSQPVTVIPILGSDRIDQLEDSVGALEVDITQQELLRLDKAAGSDLMPHRIGRGGNRGDDLSPSVPI